MNRFIYWLISVLLSVMTNCVQAQVAYPTREVKLIAGFAAGGATDTIARYYAKKLTSDLIYQSVFLRNNAQSYLSHRLQQSQR